MVGGGICSAGKTPLAFVDDGENQAGKRGIKTYSRVFTSEVPSQLGNEKWTLQ